MSARIQIGDIYSIPLTPEGSFCGRMTERDLDLVLQTIAASPLVPAKIKKEIGLIPPAS